MTEAQQDSAIAAMNLAAEEFDAITAILNTVPVPRGDIDGLWSTAQRVEWLARQYGHFLKK